MLPKLDNRIRLMIGQFLLGMMFFYGVEQLFINQLSSSAARGAVTLAFTVGVLAFEIPTGLFADKFGRKRSLLLGCLAGLVAVIVLASSYSLVVYLIGCIVFGLFICLLNGAAEALLYDWLATQSKQKLFAKYQGGIYAAYLLGAGVANVFSGVIAEHASLRLTYMLSVIPILIAFIVLLGLEEPPMQPSSQKRAWYSHMGEVWRLFKANPRLIAFSTQVIMTEVLFLTVAEFGQIYMLSFGISAVTLGLFWAVDAVFAAGGRGFAHRFQSRPRQLVLVFCAVLTVFTFVEHKIGIGLFWLLWGMTEMLANVAETEVQHETTSEIRATVVSTISFAGNLIGIPILIAYTAYYKSVGIFSANRALIFGVIAILVVTLFVRPPKQLAGFETSELPPKPTI